MKKNLQRCGCVVLTLLLIWVGVHKLGYYLRPVDTDACVNAIQSFHDMPKNEYEVIGYGSSHLWRGFEPKELYDTYGIKAYNYGCNWQNIDTTLLFLKDSLRTQKPKVALIETYNVGSFKDNQDMDGEIYYTTAIPGISLKKEYLTSALGNDKERWLSYYMPLCAFHDNWINLTKDSFYKDVSYSYDFHKTAGFMGGENSMPIDIPDYRDFEQADLFTGSVARLDEIVRVCRENDIQIVFYTAPYVGPYCYFDAMDRYAKENGQVYINLFEHMDEIGIDTKTDFSDEGHLNSQGARKVSAYLGKFLVENYELTDYR